MAEPLETQSSAEPFVPITASLREIRPESSPGPPALRNHLPEIGPVAAQGINHLHSLPVQEFPHAEHHRGS